jgi:GT2 family glycosyltransferase
VTSTNELPVGEPGEREAQSRVLAAKSVAGPGIYIIIPTFREPAHVAALLSDLRQQSWQAFSVVVINSDPGDATSRLLARGRAGRGVVELTADPSVYWSGAIEIGQRWVLDRAGPEDLVMFLNADIRLSSDFLERIARLLPPLGRTMVAPATVAGGSFVSSGCRVVSWPLALTRHVLVGRCRPVGSTLMPVDMLAGRALCFPARALREVGLVAARQLPHYHSDYEYTARAHRQRYCLYVVPDLQVWNDVEHTGIKSSNPHSTLWQRLRGLASIKSSANLKYRTRFVLLTYPRYSLPSALFINWMKAFLEISFGETPYRLFTLRGTTER